MAQVCFIFIHSWFKMVLLQICTRSRENGTRPTQFQLNINQLWWLQGNWTLPQSDIQKRGICCCLFLFESWKAVSAVWKACSAGGMRIRDLIAATCAPSPTGTQPSGCPLPEEQQPSDSFLLEGRGNSEAASSSKAGGKFSSQQELIIGYF